MIVFFTFRIFLVSERCKDFQNKKMADKARDKERTATAAFLRRGLGKGEAKGGHSSAQSQGAPGGLQPGKPGFFSFTGPNSDSSCFDLDRSRTMVLRTPCQVDQHIRLAGTKEQTAERGFEGICSKGI